MNGGAERIILSLGGSLVFPETHPDTHYLTQLKSLLEKELSLGRMFFVIVGGGRITRIYQNTLKELTTPTDDALDWLGIAATHLNARFVREVFGDAADPAIVTDPTHIESSYPLVFGGGWKPGWSTDYVAVKAAETLGAHKVINLTNTAYVYDKDPNLNSDAKRLADLSWQEYRSLIPSQWTPGLSTPFDPIASTLAEKNGLSVAIMEGKNLESIREFIEGRPFEGTLIHP